MTRAFFKRLRNLHPTPTNVYRVWEEMCWTPRLKQVASRTWAYQVSCAKTYAWKKRQVDANEDSEMGSSAADEQRLLMILIINTYDVFSSSSTTTTTTTTITQRPENG